MTDQEIDDIAAEVFGTMATHQERQFARTLLSCAIPEGHVVVPGWQPIETAPKGVNSLLYSSKRGNIFIGNWDDFDRINEPKITLWHPLPAAPAPEGEA